MGPDILIVVVYSPEKTIGTLVGVSSTSFSSNLKNNHLFCPILANYPYSLLSKMIKTGRFFISKVPPLNEMRQLSENNSYMMNNINLSIS